MVLIDNFRILHEKFTIVLYTGVLNYMIIIIKKWLISDNYLSTFSELWQNFNCISVYRINIEYNIKRHPFYLFTFNKKSYDNSIK